MKGTIAVSRPGVGNQRDPDAAYVRLHTMPAPPAYLALSPAALEARLQVYQYLAERRLPLFEASDEPQSNGERCSCWGCGRRTPIREETGRRMQPDSTPGWVRREVIADGVRQCVMLEIWCPECAAMGGYGCVEEVGESERTVRRRATA